MLGVLGKRKFYVSPPPDDCRIPPSWVYRNLGSLRKTSGKKQTTPGRKCGAHTRRWWAPPGVSGEIVLTVRLLHTTPFEDIITPLFSSHDHPSDESLEVALISSTDLHHRRRHRRPPPSCVLHGKELVTKGPFFILSAPYSRLDRFVSAGGAHLFTFTCLKRRALGEA